MSCYKWELEAILEGLMLKKLDQREMYTELAFHLRYVLNAKKPRVKKIFNKEKEERKILKLFRKSLQKENERIQAIKKATEYFSKKGKEGNK